MTLLRKGKDRLHELIDLALVVRGWSKTDLARALHRDPSNLYPNTDDPKMKFLVGLSDALEWPLELVTDYIANGVAPTGDIDEEIGSDKDFEAVLDEARAAYRDGEYARTVELARKLLALAKTPTQRAIAYDKEAIGWDGLGRFTKSMNAKRRGSLETPIPVALRLQMQGNLASTLCSLSEFAAARGTAQSLLDWFDEHPPETQIMRVIQAFAYFVRGSVSQRWMALEEELKLEHAANAKRDMGISLRLHAEISQEFDRREAAGIANTCKGAIIEADVELGLREPEDAIRELIDGLPESLDPDKCPPGDWLESYGWWCIFGGELALRHLSGPQLQRAMAILTNKAFEIADKMSNWEFRERALRMQYQTHISLKEATGLDIPLPLDNDDMRLIAGTIGRFPAFRDVGWGLLRAGKVLGDGHEN